MEFKEPFIHLVNTILFQGAKTVIPAKVIGKFSIRSVPNMEPEEITKLVKAHLEKQHSLLNTKTSLKVECGHAGKWWIAGIV